MDRKIEKPKKTIAVVSEYTLKIQNYLQTKCKNGDELSFERIHHETGVVMDEKGKGYLRTAMKRAKIEYSAMIGYGVKLADVKSIMPILSNRLVKIDRAVKRADKTHKNLQEQFFEALSPSEQKQLLYVGAVFGAIRVAAENGKLVYQNKTKIDHTITIPIPKFE